MREQLAEALNTATKNQERRRVCTLRLISAAIKDRDVANRTAGRDPVGDEDIQLILAKMIKQRVDSAKGYDEDGRPELAAQEREEIGVIKEFLPPQLDPGAIEQACKKVVEETDARGLRDVGRCMHALKERYPGQMDFNQASTMVKGLLR
ncbi:MAG TPA: GatB/YqeY domain-containing protein [Aurantimonas sp.]|nr:GatB/YqeY domain-containing protein [Aurantimonas sp.]